jgi:hypothetical protein
MLWVVEPALNNRLCTLIRLNELNHPRVLISWTRNGNTVTQLHAGLHKDHPNGSFTFLPRPASSTLIKVRKLEVTALILNDTPNTREIHSSTDFGRTEKNGGSSIAKVCQVEFLAPWR